MGTPLGVELWFDQNFDAVLILQMLDPPREAVFGGYWRDTICKAPATEDDSPLSEDRIRKWQCFLGLDRLQEEAECVSEAIDQDTPPRRRLKYESVCFRVV